MNPSTAQAWVLVDELVRCGVYDVVLSPGSRSAPLALALAAAEQREEIRLHVRLDERSAGYLALGLARGSGEPVAVVTTSGTAAVNLHPAVTEASYAGLPLLAITADRPPQLRDTGANQTIDQPGLYAGDARWAVDLAPATREPGQVRYWRSTVARAVAVAADLTDPGPVHLNVPFAAPLVPDAGADTPAGSDPAAHPGSPDHGWRDADWPDADWPESLAGRPDGRPWTVDGRLSGALAMPVEAALQPVLGGTGLPARGLVVLGDHADAEAVELADELCDAMGWPLLSEPTGGGAGAALALAHGPLLLAAPGFAGAHVPDLVITVGRVGLTRAVLRLIDRAGCHVVVDPRPPRRPADPTRTADLVLAAVPLPPESEQATDDTWLADWQQADAVAAQVCRTLLPTTGTPSGPVVARLAAGAVPEGGLLVTGASWPVRHLEAYAGSALAGIAVIGNRGTSGIDGTVSMAWGAATAAGVPTIALLGDLAFRYDAGGLVVPATEPPPDLVYVVIDNDGGGIFSALEQGEPRFADRFERVFGTPTGLDPADLARAAGLPVVTVTRAEDLAATLADAVGSGGVHVVVVRTLPRADEAGLLVELATAVAEALDGADGPGTTVSGSPGAPGGGREARHGARA